MPTVITLPDGFEYVGVAITSTFFVLMYQTILVGNARNRAGVKYPQLYAEKEEAEKNKDAMIFNCTQRAHQNSLETIAPLIAGTFLVGLKYPLLAAVFCGTWSFSRIPYTWGYTSGNPDKRNGLLAELGFFSFFGLVLTSSYVWSKAAITGVF